MPQARDLDGLVPWYGLAVLAPGTTLHVYGVEGDPPGGEVLAVIPGLVGVLDEEGWSYLVFTEPAAPALARAGVAVGYEASLRYEEWLDGEALEPLAVAGLVVVPPWCEPPEDAAGRSLLMEHSLAFGTGAHPTTRRCLELLARLFRDEGPPETLLDLGCGTGLLSLGGLRLGAGRAVGCDTSRLAVEVARRNAIRNGLETRARFLLAGAREVDVEAEVIVANLPPAAASELLAHPGLGRCRAALLSGLLRSHALAIEASLPPEVELVEVHVDGAWHTALLRPRRGAPRG